MILKRNIWLIQEKIEEIKQNKNFLELYNSGKKKNIIEIILK